MFTTRAEQEQFVKGLKDARRGAYGQLYLKTEDGALVCMDQERLNKFLDEYIRDMESRLRDIEVRDRGA